MEHYVLLKQNLHCQRKSCKRFVSLSWWTLGGWWWLVGSSW